MCSEPPSLVPDNWPGIAEKGSASLWRARASRLASRAGNAFSCAIPVLWGWARHPGAYLRRRGAYRELQYG